MTIQGTGLLPNATMYVSYGANDKIQMSTQTVTSNSLTATGYYFQRQYDEDLEGREGASLTIGRRLNQYWSASAGVRVENVNISGVADPVPIEHGLRRGRRHRTAQEQDRSRARASHETLIPRPPPAQCGPPTR